MLGESLSEMRGFFVAKIAKIAKKADKKRTKKLNYVLPIYRYMPL
jgi:hypothetical protein